MSIHSLFHWNVVFHDFCFDTIAIIQHICLPTALFQNAKNKLKDAETITDINSDQDFTVMKQRRRVRAANKIIYSDDDETPPKKSLVTQLPDFPPQPKTQYRKIISPADSQRAGSIHTGATKQSTQSNGGEPLNNGSSCNNSTSRSALIAADNRRSPNILKSRNILELGDGALESQLVIDRQDMLDEPDLLSLDDSQDMFDTQATSQYQRGPSTVKSLSTTSSKGSSSPRESDTRTLQSKSNSTPNSKKHCFD